MEDRIIEIVVSKDEVTWQTMILDLIKVEHMDPMDINITLLTQKYLEMLKNLKGLDFRVSGKMVLAAAILLRLKTTKLVGEDMMDLDRLMRPQEEVDGEAFYEELEQGQATGQSFDGQYPQLMPRTPQPRKRKVSIYDLMNALQQALEVRDRRTIRRMPIFNLRMPEKKVDISKLINGTYDQIVAMFKVNTKLTFSQLTPSDKREDKIYTFIPLLFLASSDERKIDLIQREHFGEVEIVLRENVAKEPAKVEAEAVVSI